MPDAPQLAMQAEEWETYIPYFAAIFQFLGSRPNIQFVIDSYEQVDLNGWSPPSVAQQYPKAYAQLKSKGFILEYCPEGAYRFTTPIFIDLVLGMIRATMPDETLYKLSRTLS